MKFVLSTSFIPVKDIPAIAQKADETGWHGLSFSDHVVHPKNLKVPYPYTPNGKRRWEAFTQWPDPMVMIGALSTITQHIEFMNNIYVLPMRNPLMAAKAISTAAVLSDNRLNLCIGVGWSKDEFELLEQDFHTRGKRCDESIEILRKLMQGGWVKHDGELYPFEELEMSPVPDKPVPIWVGGISKFALRRAAQFGDGWVSDLQSSKEITDSIVDIKEQRQKLGTDNENFSVMASPNDAFMPEQFMELEDNGVTHIMTMPWHFYQKPPFTLEQQLDSIERFYHNVIVKCP